VTKRSATLATPPATETENALTLDGIAEMLACSRRQVERWKSAGKLPKPDFTVGRLPRWWPSTIRRWLAGGGPK
jgi:predicted DNA-binding transcriptional regulator AlpA